MRFEGKPEYFRNFYFTNYMSSDVTSSHWQPWRQAADGDNDTWIGVANFF